MSAERLSVGLLVTHRMWGIWKVIHLNPQNAWVYCKDIEGTPKDAVKQLKRRVAVLTTAAGQSDSLLDNLPPMVRNGRVETPHRLRITEKQAVDRFVAKFPRAFDDPEYWKYERNYKWKAHLQVATELLGDRGRRIVAEGPTDALVNMLRKLLHLTNLLATQELIALNDAFRTLTGITLPRSRRAKQRKRGCALVELTNLYRSLSLVGTSGPHESTPRLF